MALPATALTTLDTVRGELGLRTSKDDAALERVIQSATAMVTGYVGRTLHYEAAVAEYVPGYGTELLLVSRTPLVSVTSITLDGATIDATSYGIKSAASGSIHRDAGWMWTAPISAGIDGPHIAGREKRSYLVTYAGGYVTPGQVAGALTRTLPYDIEEACILTVVHLWRLRGKFTSVEQETEEADDAVWAGGMPAGARRMLRPHVRLS